MSPFRHAIEPLCGLFGQVIEGTHSPPVVLEALYLSEESS